MPASPADRDRLNASINVFRFSVRFDKHLELPTDKRFVLLERDRLLQFHDVAATSVGLVLWNPAVQSGRVRSGLRRIGEDANVIEFGLFNEPSQRPELRVRLTRIANDERRAHHRIGELVSGVIDEAARHVDVTWPVHLPQHGAVGMLNRHV